MYPFSLRMKPSYPANNLRGQICMGQGVPFVGQTRISASVNNVGIAIACVLLFWMFFFSNTTERFLKGICPTKTFKSFNSDHRYQHLDFSNSTFCIIRRNFLNFFDTQKVIRDLLFAQVIEWFGYKICMITESSNNTNIFIFSTILSLLFDLYFLIFLPFMWIYAILFNLPRISDLMQLK